MRTQVAIIGGGPSGLLLAQLLQKDGIDAIVLERRSRSYVESRIRAGVLETGFADLMREAGVAARLDREGLTHDGVILSYDDDQVRIDFSHLAGKTVTVYGQTEVTRDLYAAREATGGSTLFEVEDVELHDLDTDRPRVTFMHDGQSRVIDCDFVAGCDGFHGIARAAVPPAALTLYERVYPFAWLGILAEAPPASEELVYARHAEGFALFSMRSPAITRLYLQCDPEETIEAWPDARVWEALHRRLEDDGGWRLNEGPVLQKGVTAMRSFVAEPLRFGRLFLAGDAAHIVPPTGAKGMNLAVADVRVLAAALVAWYREGRRDLLDAYSATCLRRVWKVQRFSWWMTQLLHRFPEEDGVQARLQLAELDYVTSSEAGARALAENYVGLPFEAKDGVA